ncbi:MAG: hypothetical protein EAZ27_08875 [Cytophagales bacterium]|nr:MAG: hypothetical protein EAZ27_08875 [Cytophagales bacterium]
MFGAKWCPPCQGLKKEIAKIKPDEIDFKIVLIVIDQKNHLRKAKASKVIQQVSFLKMELKYGEKKEL